MDSWWRWILLAVVAVIAIAALVGGRPLAMPIVYFVATLIAAVYLRHWLHIVVLHLDGATKDEIPHWLDPR